MTALPKHFRTTPKRGSRARLDRPRKRWPRHLKFIREHECANPHCRAKPPNDPAHVRTGTDGGAGLKPADWWTVPLCRKCHNFQHSVGEFRFENETGIDMKALALALALALARRSPDARMKIAMKEAGIVL